MAEKERAEELVATFKEAAKGEIFYDWGYYHRKCAKVAVHEIMDALLVTTGHCELRGIDHEEVQRDLKYWNRVLEHIDGLT